MTNQESTPEDRARYSLARLRTRPLGLMAGVALGFLAIGAAAGTGGSRLIDRWSPQPVMLLQVTPIDKLGDDTAAAIKGRVAEIFGNKFILDDGSAHALVDLGPRGDNADIVSKGETITAQGRFDRGVLHAQMLAHADGRTEGFGPPPPPPDDRGTPGPRARDDAAPPPPVPSVDVPPLSPSAR